MANGEKFRDGVDALNARDWARHRALLADSMTYEDFGTGATLTGADAFIAQQQEQVAPFDDARVTITTLVEHGDTVMAELVSEGKHTAAIPLPMGGTIPPTGKTYAVHVVAITEYGADGLAVKCRAYHNPLEILTQLGVAPGVPAQISLTEPVGTPAP